MLENFDHAAGSREPLPLDTVAAVQLLDLFRDPDHDVDRIVDFISQDPLLTAETLRRCNNATFHGAMRVTDVFEAVSRLGYYELYDIIASSVGGAALLEAAGNSDLQADGFLAMPAQHGGPSVHSRNLGTRDDNKLQTSKSPV